MRSMYSHCPLPEIVVDVKSCASTAYKDLLWHVFFESRSRGISFATNIPWIVGSTNSYFVEVQSRGQLVAGLSVRIGKSPDGNYTAGIIGLVCVHSEQRGKGFSSLALDAAVSHARNLGLDDLVLWTSKPAVYEKFGFKSMDSAIFGTVVSESERRVRGIDCMKSVWPDPLEMRGLPAFAKMGYRWSTPRASAVILEDASGVILADWSGADADVLQLLAQAMPDQWRINALKIDDIVRKLSASGSWSVDVNQSTLQMLLNLRPRNGPVDPYLFRLLDRI